MQAQSAWNLEAQNVVSQYGLHLPQRIPEAFSTRGHRLCGLGNQRLILTITVPCALNSALQGDHCPAVGSAPGATWDLTLTLPYTYLCPSNET